jgi:phage terminase small subunit
VALNPRQLRFVEEYLVDCNASAACRRAGYSAKNANVTGPALGANLGIAAEIEKRQQKRAGQVGLSAEDILRKWRDLAENGENDAVRLAAVNSAAKHLGMARERVELSGSLSLEQLVVASIAEREVK